MDIKNIYGKVVYTAPKATTMQEAVDQAIADKVTMRGWVISNCKVSYCTVSYCTVSDCTVSGGTVREKPLAFLKGFAGLYKYNVWSVLFADGSRWVRMGCLFKSLEDWDKIGIRKSNLSEFPDDGSDRSEERAAAFEFAKAAALRMKLPKEGTNA